MKSTVELSPAVEQIIDARRRVPNQRTALIAISGIDASGKGYVTAKLTEALEARGTRVANINIDGWLNLPAVRFSTTNPAEHFYRHAIRFDDMFEQLILPLRSRRSIVLTMDFAAETATAFRQERIALAAIDVILLEGIYLLKRQFTHHYDYALWIECSFETALNRAIARAQEGLAAQETIQAYQTIYFPAQELHFARDNPQIAAQTVLPNDPRLARSTLHPLPRH